MYFNRVTIRSKSTSSASELACMHIDTSAQTTTDETERQMIQNHKGGRPSGRPRCGYGKSSTAIAEVTQMRQSVQMRQNICDEAEFQCASRDMARRGACAIQETACIPRTQVAVTICGHNPSTAMWPYRCQLVCLRLQKSVIQTDSTAEACATQLGNHHKAMTV